MKFYRTLISIQFISSSNIYRYDYNDLYDWNITKRKQFTIIKINLNWFIFSSVAYIITFERCYHNNYIGIYVLSYYTSSWRAKQKNTTKTTFHTFIINQSFKLCKRYYTIYRNPFLMNFKLSHNWILYRSADRPSSLLSIGKYNIINIYMYSLSSTLFTTVRSKVSVRFGRLIRLPDLLSFRFLHQHKRCSFSRLFFIKEKNIIFSFEFSPYKYNRWIHARAVLLFTNVYMDLKLKH